MTDQPKIGPREALAHPPRSSASGHPEILSRMNDELNCFAFRWKLDGDYLRCRRCDRPCIASRADEDFRHSASCKAIDPESRPWRSLLAILEPLGRITPPAPAVPDDVMRDAARYRWLRQRDWFDSPMCVITAPKTNTKLGAYCPSQERLDEAIDAAMLSSATELPHG